MTAINPNETARSWMASKREQAVHLFVSGVDGDAGALVGTRAAGFPLALTILAAEDGIDPHALAGAVAAVVQVDQDSPESVKRFQQLAKSSDVPLIAAVYEPPLALVRSLVRAGAHDVVPLPLTLDELETALAPVRDELSKRQTVTDIGKGKLVTIIKSEGGVGATALLTQLALRFAGSEAARRREVCLIDLDVQFGDAAFQLGTSAQAVAVRPARGGDPARRRLAARHDDAAPERTQDHRRAVRDDAARSGPSEHVLQIVEMATREFGTVFIDLPTNWTNWSLSLVARSDLVLLVTELTVAGLARSRRQLELLDSRISTTLDVRVIVNRYEKSLARTIRPADVRQALGRDMGYTVANDFPLMRAAIDRGVPIDEIKRKSALGKDLDTLDAGIAAALGLER